MSHPPVSSASDRPLSVAIAIVLIGYLVTAVFHGPQRGTDLIVAAERAADQPALEPGVPHAAAGHHPPYWMVAPFVLLLGAIAILPLAPAAAHWWDDNLHRFYVAGGLALVTLAYYALLHAAPIEAHWPAPHTAWPAAAGPNVALTAEVLANAILSEYVPFMILLFSLYTISGGIRIEGDLPAHPLTNCASLPAAASWPVSSAPRAPPCS